MMRPIILIPLPFHFLTELPKRRGFLVGGVTKFVKKGGNFKPYNDIAIGRRNNRAYTKRRGGGSDGGWGKGRKVTRRGEHPYFLGGELSVEV